MKLIQQEVDLSLKFLNHFFFETLFFLNVWHNLVSSYLNRCYVLSKLWQNSSSCWLCSYQLHNRGYTIRLFQKLGSYEKVPIVKNNCFVKKYPMNWLSEHFYYKNISQLNVETQTFLFESLALFNFERDWSFLWAHLFLGKIFTNSVSPDLNLHKWYCHIVDSAHTNSSTEGTLLYKFTVVIK